MFEISILVNVNFTINFRIRFGKIISINSFETSSIEFIVTKIQLLFNIIIYLFCRILIRDFFLHFPCVPLITCIEIIALNGNFHYVSVISSVLSSFNWIKNSFEI